MLRKGVTYLVLLTAGFVGKALVQKPAQDKATDNRKQAEALRKEAASDYEQSETQLRKMRADLGEARKAEVAAAQDRKDAKEARHQGQGSLASQLDQQAAEADTIAKRFNDDAAKDRQKADSLLASARAAWQKSQDFEKTPCPNNMPYCAPTPTHR